jgi:hypothetical protein
LSLIAEEDTPGVVAFDGAQKPEAFGQEPAARLTRDGFEFLVQLVLQVETGIGEGVVNPGGEEAGFELGGAEHGNLGQGHALEGEEFLGVDGLIQGDEVFAEARDGIDFFSEDDDAVGGGETMLARVSGRAGFAFGGARAGGMGGIGAVGGKAFFGDGFGGRMGFRRFRHLDVLFGIGRRNRLPHQTHSMMASWSLKSGKKLKGIREGRGVNAACVRHASTQLRRSVNALGS